MFKDRIEFDEQDRNLFEISDLRLRADALKHSVLPRLQALMHVCIDMIRDVYGVEVLDDSILSLSPNFRTRREREIQVAYHWASVDLGGKRRLGMWPGIARKDGKSVQIVPYVFGFGLTADGLRFQLASYAMRLTDASKRGLLTALMGHGALISELCRAASIPGLPPLMSEIDRLRQQLNDEDLEVGYFGETLEYPVREDEVKDLAFRFVLFFPVYDLCIQYAKGEPDRFNRMVRKLNTWLATSVVGRDTTGVHVQGPPVSEEAVALAAGRRIKVLPALRWQVFQRDGWKCVACGRQSHDGVLLHVDHILPRSKGGKDALDNLQTLCGECNLGKSNRDSTNLRAKK